MFLFFEEMRPVISALIGATKWVKQCDSAASATINQMLKADQKYMSLALKTTLSTNDYFFK